VGVSDCDPYDKNSKDECHRSIAEYVGILHPKRRLDQIISAIVIFLSILICRNCYKSSRKWNRENSTNEMRDENAVELAEEHTYLLQFNNDIASESQASSEEISTQHVNTITRTKHFCSQFIIVLLFTIACLFVIKFIPKEPKLNLCSQKLKWESIFEGIFTLHLEASFDLLLSLYNPNSFKILVSKATGVLLYSNSTFGNYQLDHPVILPAYSVMDDTVQVTIDPELIHPGLDMLHDFWKGDLNITVFSQLLIVFPQLYNFSFSVNVISKIFNLGRNQTVASDLSQNNQTVATFQTKDDRFFYGLQKEELLDITIIWDAKLKKKFVSDHSLCACPFEASD